MSDSELSPEETDSDSDSDSDLEEVQYYVYAPAPITIQVNTLIGTSFCVGVFPADTIHVVKQRIGLHESLNPAHQHLLLGSRELKDTEIVRDVGLSHGSHLTLIMTLRGGPAPVGQRQRDNFLAAVQNRPSIASAVSTSIGGSDPRPNLSECLEIVLVKCDGSVHVYYMPKPSVNANPGPTRARSEADSGDSGGCGEAMGSVSSAHKWATQIPAGMYSESDEEEYSYSEDENVTPRAELTPQTAVDNCRTRTRMAALQQKMARKRQKKRKRLIKQTRASPATARREVPSPRVKPHSMLPFNERVHQYPKTLGYVKATQRLNILKAEMYLQSKRNKNVYGWSPYTMTQLGDYVTSKLHVLIEDEGYERPTTFCPIANPLTPTVLLKDPYTSSSEVGETESNRSQVQTARTNTVAPAVQNRQPLSTTRTSSVTNKFVGTGVGRCTTAAPALIVPTVESPPTPRLRKMHGVPSARPTTCYNFPFNEVPPFDFSDEDEDYDGNNYDEVIDTPRWREEVQALGSNQTRPQSNNYGPMREQLKVVNANMIQSLTHAFSEFNRAGSGVKSGRHKCKTSTWATRAPAVSTGAGDSSGPSTQEQEPIIDIMTEPESEAETGDTTTHVGPKKTESAHGSTMPEPSVTAEPAPTSSSQEPREATSTTEVKEANPGKNADVKRCAECKKKLTVVNDYKCRCGKFFCSIHRYGETHNCTYDYKAEGRRIIEKANPVVTADKINHI